MQGAGADITCGCFGHASKNWNFNTHLGPRFRDSHYSNRLWVSTARNNEIVGQASRLPHCLIRQTGTVPHNRDRSIKSAGIRCSVCRREAHLFMIRKLKSVAIACIRKKNSKTGKPRNLGTFKTRALEETTKRRWLVFQGVAEICLGTQAVAVRPRSCSSR